jgi:hypothetical protein
MLCIILRYIDMNIIQYIVIYKKQIFCLYISDKFVLIHHFNKFSLTLL